MTEKQAERNGGRSFWEGRETSRLYKYWFSYSTLTSFHQELDTLKCHALSLPHVSWDTTFSPTRKSMEAVSLTSTDLVAELDHIPLKSILWTGQQNPMLKMTDVQRPTG